MHGETVKFLVNYLLYVPTDAYIYIYNIYIYMCVCTRVGSKVPGLTNKSHAKWKMLRGIYSTTYGEVNVPVRVEIMHIFIYIYTNLYIIYYTNI
jgi:hypothetical protein